MRLQDQTKKMEKNQSDESKGKIDGLDGRPCRKRGNRTARHK